MNYSNMDRWIALFFGRCQSLCTLACKWIVLVLMAFGACLAHAAAPSYQAAGTAVSATGVVSPAWPAHAIDDVALLFVESAGGEAATLSVPAGFVAVANSPTGAGTAGTRITVFWARATSTSMAAPTVADPGNHVYAQIITYRNVFPTGNPWDVIGSGIKAAASTALTVTGVTTTVADTLVVQVAARDDDANGAEFSAQTNANLVGIAERSDAGTTSGNGGGFSVWDGSMAAAGATGSTTVTVVNSINAFLTIALKPDIFEVTEDASTATVPVNTNFTLTLTARNPVNGNNQTGVTITDNLTTAGLTFVSFTPSSGTFTFTGGVLTWTVGNMAAGVTATATLTVSAATAGAKTNTITSNIGTPAATASATVNVYAPLADWRLDETTWTGVANEVKDSSGGGYHGRSRIASGATSVATTATGSPAYTSGSQNTCRYGEFDKSTAPARSFSYVELSGLPALPSSFTFAAWIRSTNSSQSGQRILVRDDADNGWGFSLGDAGSTRIRFFNRNISPSGTVVGDGTNNACGTVFCLDTAAVITNNSWFFVAVTIDTAGKNIAHYVYNAAGTLVSSTSSAFSGNWVDGTGTAAIGGETSASSEGRQASFHFQGNIDEMQIYSGVLSQSDVNVLRTRTRTCGVSVDHYELSLPTASLACLPSTVTVTACADASSPCSNAVTTINGQTATLASAGPTLGASTITFNASGVATTTLSYPSATDGAAASVILSAEQATATNARKCCPNGTSCAAGNFCSTTFNTAGFIVSGNTGAAAVTIPSQVAGTNSASYYLRAIKTNTTTQACESALTGAQSVNWAYECNNPTTCSASNLMTLNGGTSTTIARNDNASVATYLPVSMTFDANGNAPFTFNYSDVGQVRLYATKAAGGALLSSLSGSSTAFVVKPGGFTVTGIKQTASPFLVNPAATNASGSKFVKAGESITATVTATTSTGAATPNYGRETIPEGVLLTHALVAPAAGATGTLANGTIAGGSFSSGVAAVTNLSWSEVGIISLTPSVADGDYLGAGSITGTAVANVGRFVPDHFDTVVVQGCVAGNFSYSGQPFTAQLTPKNLAGAITQNYNTACGFSKAVTLSNAGSATNVNVGWPPPGPATQAMASTQFNNPAACGDALSPLAGPSGTQANVTYTLASATGPATFTLRGVDTDGVTSNGTAEGTTAVRSGRVRLVNAYGSELLDLPMTLRAEYWNGTGWIKNTDDSCTGDTVSLAANAVSVTLTQTLSSPTCVLDTGAPGRSGAGCSAVGPTSPTDKQFRKGAAMVNTSATLQKGDFNLWLKAPTAAGTVKVDVDVPPWLEFPWVGVGSTDPSARATFGVFKSPLIYRRENY